MLGYFFRHYDRFVDRYFIYDNQSDDGSLELLAEHPRVTIIPLHLEGDSYIMSSFEQVNQLWHKSRGEADWVTVVNIDEFLWHPDMPWYLRKAREAGITFMSATGFQMVSDSFPAPDDDLPRSHRFGMRLDRFDKPAFFNPDAIRESNFKMARHGSKPRGNVVRPAKDEILLLHYKFLGRDYLEQRHAELNARRRSGDVANEWGFHYDPEKTRADFEEVRRQRRTVVPRWPLAARLARRFAGSPVAVEPQRRQRNS